jgi:AbrB family looped-hinge helix DNA binding protein
MSFATITSKGQTTIPKDIRDGLGLRPGDKVRFTLLSDGTVVMRAKRRSIRDLAGALYDPAREPIPVDEMTPWR